jgi:hypothetical protein
MEIRKKIKELQAMLVAPQAELNHLATVRLLAALETAERNLAPAKVEEVAEVAEGPQMGEVPEGVVTDSEIKAKGKKG